MPIIVIPIIITVVAVALVGIDSYLNPSKKNALKPKKMASNYIYKPKKYIMTPTERAFFSRLDRLFSDKYYVFPQIHLSSLLDEKIKGQNWNTAFKYTNNWSVDYILCDKETLKTICAIELDDPTHNRNDRIERDKQKNIILARADVTLIRFSNIQNLHDRDIVNEVLKRCHYR